MAVTVISQYLLYNVGICLNPIVCKDVHIYDGLTKLVFTSALADLIKAKYGCKFSKYRYLPFCQAMRFKGQTQYWGLPYEWDIEKG